MKKLSFQDFVKEVLRGAEYKKGKDFDCVVAIARDLPGCMTQGDNYEEARENLIDAIELWITSALRDGEQIPSVRGNGLILLRAESQRVQRKAAMAKIGPCSRGDLARKLKRLGDERSHLKETTGEHAAHPDVAQK